MGMSSTSHTGVLSPVREYITLDHTVYCASCAADLRNGRRKRAIAVGAANMLPAERFASSERYEDGQR